MNRVHLSLSVIVKRVCISLGLSILILIGSLGLLGAFPARGLAKPLLAPTLISNTITVDTIWTTAGSPYILSGSVTIAPNITLTIEAGVEVQGQSNSYLDIQGHLETLGTTTNPVTFTSETDTGPGQWDGIYIGDDGSANLQYTHIRYAGEGVEQPALYVAATGQVNLQNSRFYDNAFHPIAIRADLLHNLSLSNNTFANNGSNRINIVTYEAPYFYDLTDNVTLVPQSGLEGYLFETDVNIPGFPTPITLTLQAGTQVMFPNNAYLDITGHLETLGTTTNPVTFTSETDTGPGQWDGIYIGDDGSANLQYTHIRYAGEGVEQPALYVAATGQVNLQNSRFYDNAFHPIAIRADLLHNLSLSNNTFANNGSNRINIVTYEAPYFYDLTDNVTLVPQSGLEGYLLESDWLAVPEFITLTLQAGTQLMFPDTTYFSVHGHLQSFGTTTNPVTITSEANAGPGEWYGMDINGGTAHLQHTSIRYAGGYSDEPALYVWDVAPNGQVILEDSAVTNNTYHPMSIRADQLHQVVLSNTSFSNTSDLVHIKTYSDPDTYQLVESSTLGPQPGLYGYLIEGNSLSVPSPSITLTLQAGTQIMFPSNTYLDVSGHLQALGTTTNPITFTSDSDSSPGEWAGIAVNSSGSVYFDHTTVRYGGEASGSNLSVYSGTAQIYNSDITASGHHGIYAEGGQVDIECSTITNNLADGVRISGSGIPNFKVGSSIISGNSSFGVDNENSVAVEARYNWWGDVSGPSGTGPGSGDAITGTINYTPWLSTVACQFVAVDDNYTTPEDTPLSVSAGSGVMNNDLTRGAVSTATVISPPLTGTLALNLDGSFVYTPTDNYNGEVTFTYNLSDGTSTDTATVTVTVTAENDAPVAQDDTATMPANTSITIDVRANDTDIEGDALTINAVGLPANGSTGTDGSTVVYTPTLNFDGTDTFTYSISDGLLTDTAIVTVTVNAADAVTQINPAVDTTLIATSTQSSTVTTVTINIPAGAVTEIVTLAYTGLSTHTHGVPANFQFAGIIFTLNIYRDGQLLSDFTFDTPITLTLEYDPASLGNLDEDTLTLFYWDEAIPQWSTDGITLVERDTVNNRLVVTIAHLTEFALFGEASTQSGTYFLPIILKNL